MNKTILCVALHALGFSTVACAEPSPSWAVASPERADTPDAAAERRAAAHRMSVAGMAVTAIGGVLGVLALAVELVANHRADDGSIVATVSGLAVGGIGVGLIAIGIPIWCVGAARENDADRRAARFAVTPLLDGRRVAGGTVGVSGRF